MHADLDPSHPGGSATCSRSCPGAPAITSAASGSDQIEALIEAFASRSPLYVDDLVLIDSTPIECARSRETVKRGGASGLADAISDAADYGYCASHSRYFWGFRLHGVFGLDGTPRALHLASPKIGEREVALGMFARLRRAGLITALRCQGICR